MLLRRGSRGFEVKSLQGFLNILANPGTEKLTDDGIFGGKTDTRVREFQRNYKLKIDGIVGPQTMGQMEKMTGQMISMPASSPTTATPGAPTTVAPEPSVAGAGTTVEPHKMSDAELDTWLRENVKDYESLRKGLGVQGMEMLKKGIKKHVDTIKILNAVGGLEALIGGHAAALVGGAAGILGGVLLTITNIVAWIQANESAEKTYGYRGAAYAMTAWMFQKPYLDRSREMRGRALEFKFEEDMKDYDDEWREATNRVKLQMEAASFKGLSNSEVRAAVQLAYANDAAAFCRDVLIGMLPLIGPQQEQHWKGNYNVVYPR